MFRLNDCWRPYPVGCSIEGSRHSTRNASGQDNAKIRVVIKRRIAAAFNQRNADAEPAVSEVFRLQDPRPTSSILHRAAPHSALPSTYIGQSSCENKRYNGAGETAVTEAARSARSELTERPNSVDRGSRNNSGVVRVSRPLPLRYSRRLHRKCLLRYTHA